MSADNEDPVERTELIMMRMGFSEPYGPYAAQLRDLTEKQVRERGLRMRGGGTWAGDVDNETRARAILEMEWNLSRGHCARCMNIDKWTVGDALCRLGMNWRIFRDKYILRLRNPYSPARQ